MRSRPKQPLPLRPVRRPARPDRRPDSRRWHWRPARVWPRAQQPKWRACLAATWRRAYRDNTTRPPLPCKFRARDGRSAAAACVFNQSSTSPSRAKLSQHDHGQPSCPGQRRSPSEHWRSARLTDDKQTAHQRRARFAGVQGTTSENRFGCGSRQHEASQAIVGRPRIKASERLRRKGNK